MSPWLPVLVIFLNCRGPGWVSVGGEEFPRLILEAAGCGVFHISSLVSPLIGGRYWVVSSSYDVFSVSRGLGGRMPRMWFDGSCSVITRRTSSFVVADGMVGFGLGLHGASNWPGPWYGLGGSSSGMFRISIHSGIWSASNRRLVLSSISLIFRPSALLDFSFATDLL